MEPILQLQGVCKSFGGVVTAKDVNLSVLPGEIHGLIGPNGAGKSTMMNLISGIYEVDKGDIMFNGENITKIPSHIRARKGIGRTFQTPRFLQRSNIRDNLMLGVDLHDQLGYANSFFGKKGSDFLGELDELIARYSSPGLLAELAEYRSFLRPEALEARLARVAGRRPQVRVTWFVPDPRKAGGRYESVEGRVRRVDLDGGWLIFSDGLCLPLAYLTALEGPLFDRAGEPPAEE